MFNRVVSLVQDMEAFAAKSGANLELAFPGPHWNDFPIVVVSWWLEAVVGLVDGRKRNADVSFMDGPYMVHVFAKRRESWQAEWVERCASGTNVIRQFDFAPDPFIRSLTACSDDLLQECSAKGWESTDVDYVILQREQLIHYVAKNRSPRSFLGTRSGTDRRSVIARVVVVRMRGLEPPLLCEN